jgi:ligand-binding sensor domain-containing protein
MFDVFSPPGMLTSRGSMVSIDSTGQLYVGHGSRAVTVDLSPLQWQLMSVALVKLVRDDHRGAIWIETEVGSVQLRQTRFGVELRARDRSSYLAVGLTKSEADDLREAAHQRKPQTNRQGES